MKINCPYHQDDTASLQIYEDGYFCFGCGKGGSFSSSKLPFKSYRKPLPENAALTIKNTISKLPTKEIRGLNLPYDSTGYYLVFPNQTYYIKRLWDADSGSKYYSPKGVVKPVYDNVVGHKTLVVIEGQINCATAISIGSDLACDYMSPGGCSDLIKPKLLNYFLPYETVIVIVDKDAVGVASALMFKDNLHKAGKKCFIHAMPTDLNDILVNHGKDKAREELKTALGMQNVRANQEGV